MASLPPLSLHGMFSFLEGKVGSAQPKKSGRPLLLLRHMASRDAIKSGRLWIECNSAMAFAAHP